MWSTCNSQSYKKKMDKKLKPLYRQGKWSSQGERFPKVSKRAKSKIRPPSTCCQTQPTRLQLVVVKGKWAPPRRRCAAITVNAHQSRVFNGQDQQTSLNPTVPLIMVMRSTGWTALHGQSPLCRMMVNPSSSTKLLGIAQQAAGLHSLPQSRALLSQRNGTEFLLRLS